MCTTSSARHVCMCVEVGLCDSVAVLAFTCDLSVSDLRLICNVICNTPFFSLPLPLKIFLHATVHSDERAILLLTTFLSISETDGLNRDQCANAEHSTASVNLTPSVIRVTGTDCPLPAPVQIRHNFHPNTLPPSHSSTQFQTKPNPTCLSPRAKWSISPSPGSASKAPNPRQAQHPPRRSNHLNPY